MRKFNNASLNVIEGKYKKYFFILPILLSVSVLFRGLNNDIWFLLTHGRYVLEFGFPVIEPFTIHEGFSFVMQQWLASVIFFITYSNFGEIGLKLLVMIAYIINMFIFLKLCLKLSKNHWINSILVTYLFAIFINLFMTTRPYIFITGIFLTELYFLEEYFMDGNKKVLLVLPGLSLFLINLQAAMWPMLFIVMVPFLLDSFRFKLGPVKGIGVEKKPLFIIFFISFVIGFVNPYGLDGMLYIKSSYGIPEINNMVTEMAPVTINSLLGVIVILLTTGIIYLYAFGKSENKSLRHFLLAIGTAYLSLMTMRGFIFFICCGLYPLSNFIHLDKIPQYNTAHPKRNFLIRKVLIVLIVFSSLIPLYLLRNGTKSIVSETLQFSDLLDRVIDDSKEGNIVLYTGYNEGGYAEFKNVATYIDPRAEVFLKKNNKVDDVLSEYYKMQTGSLFYKEVLDKYPFTHIIVSKGDILSIYLPYDKDYILIASNDEYKLFKPTK